ncbi:serine/threonine-protein kinase ULK4-like isoform X2 [Stigmatopora argus]
MENINLYEELGKDCVSVVYKGRRMGTLNYVALKCSEKAKRPEVTNHVRLSKDLDHPNIVRFYEWYETRKHLWLVVELCTDKGKRKYDSRYQEINIRKRFQGSPTYMAPEVLQGSEATVKSDLWSLGCVLYYMYTGKPPFSSKTYSELKEMILFQEPPCLTQKVSQATPSQDFKNLQECLLEKNPDERMMMPELLKHSFWALKERN